MAENLDEIASEKFDKEEYKEKRKQEINGSKVNCKKGYKRQMLVLKETLIKKVKQEAINQDKTISDLVGEILEEKLKELQKSPWEKVTENR